MRQLVSRSWGRSRKALLATAVLVLVCSSGAARVGAESRLWPRRPAPCAFARAAQVVWETNSLTPMSTFEEVPDNYLMALAEAVAERLRAEGERCTVKPKHYAVNVLVHRDDGEQQGLWFSASRYGRTLPQSVNVHGLWPLYDGRENSPYSSAPTVSVSYGREPVAAAKDILRRFLPLYLPKWKQALVATVNARDRDAKRDALAEQFRQLPGVDVWRGQSKERMELRWPGEDHECLMLTVYGGGTVNIERGTLREDRLLDLLRGVSQVSEPAAGYGEEEDPFRPCALCGRVKGDTCLLLGEQVVEPWELRGDALVCMGCGVAMRTSYPMASEHRNEAAERKPLYGVAAKVHRYLENDRRATLERLQDLQVVLERHHAVADYTGLDRWQRKAEDERAHQALWNNRERIALEMRLRNAELVRDSIRCRIGNAECLFLATTLPELIRSYRMNTKQAA